VNSHTSNTLSDSLIIDARAQLRWHRRLFSDASTAVAWGFWLWLWRPVLSALSWMLGIRFGMQHTVVKLLALGAPVTVGNTAVALFGTSGLLLLWNQISARREPQVRSPELPEYAAHFGLTTNELRYSRGSQVCTVYHDEQGHIVRLDSQFQAGTTELELAA
jgi:poly-beta-1,6-N-acetyl-D-glucosamine biosynthesis protein PgaD